MALRSPVLNVMIKAVEKAARGLIRDFGELEQLQVSVRGISDFVTQADLRAEKTIRLELAKARPGFGFLMEERGAEEGRDPSHRWVVDPLDGITNFLHGIPQFSISIALEREGEIIAGVIYNPINNELFWSEKGGGAYLNDHRLRVSSRRKLDEAVIAIGIPHKGRVSDTTTYLQQISNIMIQTAGIRRFGAPSLDLAWVAAGRVDGYWEWGLSPWNIAAGYLLVKEAGGYISGQDKDEPLTSGHLLASNEPLHYALLKLIRTP